LTVDSCNWKMKSYIPLLIHIITEIKNTIAFDESFILVDEDQFATNGKIAGRKVIPFTEKNGSYWGPPINDQYAISELEHQRQSGASYIFFVPPALW
ncbi:MAG: hypothetical protein LH629_02915, partial [Ignavibacteria bacterium]|nr:hypothetical protein [Ignavibacteria bacterium]